MVLSGIAWVIPCNAVPLAAQPFTKHYLMAFHTCSSGCQDPRNHVTRLVESDDGISWMPVEYFVPFNGSVPDLITRGSTAYLFNPGQVRSWDTKTQAWSAPRQVQIRDSLNFLVPFVDPSPIIDDSGRIVLFFLNSTGNPPGQDPAGCNPYPCVKHFDSAIEGGGSDGAAFRLQPGHRLSVTLQNGTASDPDIFRNDSGYVLYVSRGQSTAAYRSKNLHGGYAPVPSLPQSTLTNAGGIPAGHFDPKTKRYWTYVHANVQGATVIRRAEHEGFGVQLGPSDFGTVMSGPMLGLDASTTTESPGFSVNTLPPIPPPNPIDWRPFFTLQPGEGRSFTVDTAAIVTGGVPVLNIANDGRIILGYSAGPGGGGTMTVENNGRTHLAMPKANRGPDGGFVYLPDGRTRLLTEEPAPNNTPNRHRSRIISWISADGLTWSKESGIRYQPGIEDDSISSVPSVAQVRDSVWRLYYVGDFYRTNGTRTAISTDWGWTWSAESRGNIIGQGFVDPQPVYLDNGIRLYMRIGFGNPDPSKAGIGYCDSDDGLHFAPEQVVLVVSDTALPRMMKLDPSVIRFPNGDIACYIGAAPMQGSADPAKVIVARANRMLAVPGDPARPTEGVELSVSPQPMRGHGVLHIRADRHRTGSVAVSDLLGRTVVSVPDRSFSAGDNGIPLTISRSGMYVIRFLGAAVVATHTMCVVR